MLSTLRNPSFRHLFAAQIVALVGTGLATVALGLLAWQLAGDNAGAVLALWLIGRGKLSPAVEEFGAGAAYWPWAMASLTVGLLILGAIRHQLREFPIFPERPTPPGTT